MVVVEVMVVCGEGGVLQLELKGLSCFSCLLCTVGNGNVIEHDFVSHLLC